MAIGKITMIYGIGTDIFDLKRFLKMAEDKVGFESFVKHSFTDLETNYSPEDIGVNSGIIQDELQDYRLKGFPTADKKLVALACLFSAKEAVFKCLNLSGNTAFHWKDIEIITNSEGKPTAEFHGLLKDHAENIAIKSLNLDISIDDDTIVSGAVIEI